MSEKLLIIFLKKINRTISIILSPGQNSYPELTEEFSTDTICKFLRVILKTISSFIHAYAGTTVFRTTLNIVLFFRFLLYLDFSTY